jgi:TonB family protein
MTPIPKDGENSAEPPSPTAPAPKAAADGSTRTQPVALEIPVTVNGARTINGSDKREPFSETTKTVLVFNHGAVIRIATPVAAGQLVFLTNEKSKKEVVCQVVKSKSGGGPSSGYVELQFTEPAAGFWGMRFPAPSGIPAAAAPGATAPASPRPVTPVALGPSATVATSTPQVPPVASASSATPAAPKAVSLALPVVPKPAAPVLSTPLPPRPAVLPPPPPVVETEPPKPLAPAATTPSPTPVSFVPPPAPLPPLAPPPSLEAKGTPGIPEIHDYSKEIAAIFAMPPVGSVQAPPASSASPAPPASPQLAAEDLKRQAATPASPSPAPSSMSSAASKFGSAPGESTQKTAGAAQQEVKPATKPLPKPPSTAPKSVSYDIDQVEEVKVPDWLAPLSRNPESSPAAAPAPVPVEQHRVPGWLAPLSHIAQPAAPSASVPAEVTPISFSSVEPPASEPSPGLQPEVSSDDAPFGGSMFDESPESAPENSTAGSSKKGLVLGLAAAALLLAGGGVWYMRQAHGGNANSSTAKAVHAPVSSQTVAANILSGAKPEAAAASPNSNPSSLAPSPASGQPVRNSPPSVVSSAPSTTPKNAAPSPRNEPPVEQPQPKKPSIGQVHLAAPVVNRGSNSSQVAEADPSLTASVPTPGSAESLSALSSGHGKEPTVPLPVGGDVKPAHLVKSVPPLYPQMARTQRISGNVSIDAVVDVDGNVGAMKVLSGPAILHRAALDAVNQWHYEPAMLDGKPTASHLTVIVQFRMQ